MRNNFTYNASIKIKELNKATFILNFMDKENLKGNHDFAILSAFEVLLNQFDGNIKDYKMFDVMDEFATFYEEILIKYCREEMIICPTIQEFEWESVQFVMDKMVEVIAHIQSKYGVEIKGN